MKRLTVLLTLVLLAACADSTTGPAPNEHAAPNASMHGAADNIVDVTNDRLEAAGSEYRIAYVEYVTTRPLLASQNIIISRDLGNKRLAFDFIPEDPRRGGVDGDPNTIDTWLDLVDGQTGSGLSTVETTGAIASAMLTWDAEACSELGTTLVPVQEDLGLVQDILGFGGGLAVPDIMHAGWLPPAFFDLLAEDGASFILGATFTLTFNEGDLNFDGMPDLAAREIYYNDAFAWGTSGATGLYDVETIALHEAGHGLSQGHFGTIRLNPNSGKVMFSPRAVMNAVYSGVNRDLDGTDESGHCGIWGHWPEGNGVL